MFRVFWRTRRTLLLPLFAVAAIAVLILPSMASATPTATTGDITGTVTEAGTGVVGLTVAAYPAGVNPVNGSAPTDEVATTAGGNYDLTNLAGGKYTVYAYPNANDGYVATFSNGATAYASSATVTVTNNATLTGQNVALAKGGTVSGTITSPAGAGVGDVEVYVEDAGGNQVRPSYSSGSGTVDERYAEADTATAGTVGAYTISGLPAGTYYLYVEGSDDAADNYADVWYGGGATQAGATAVPVALDTTVTANQALTKAAEITGTLTGLGATGAAAYVYAYSADGNEVGDESEVNTATGAYTITDLLPGTYYLQYDADNTSATTFVDDAWYAGSGFAESEPTATPITVAAGASATATTLSLPTGGTLSGTVTASSNPASGVTVTLYDSAGNELDEETTAADGTYEFGGNKDFYLPGNYKVGFSTNESYYFFEYYSGANLAFQYYSNASTLAAATLVPIPGGGAGTAGINAALSAGGSITGTVTAASTGAPLAGVTVYLEDAQGNQLESTQTVSGDNGTYTLAGIPTGSYYLEFVPLTGSGPTYQTEYYGGKQVLAGSTAVSVTAGSITSGINAALGPITAPAQVTTVSTTTNVPVPVPAAIPTVAGTTPAITGTAKVGSKLTARVSGWTAGTAFSYQWYAAGKAITGATASTYTPAAAQYKKTITVLVEGKLSGYVWTTKASAATKAVVAGTLKTVAPKITGTATVGKKLAAKTGTWTKGTKFTYQWYANKKAIRKATKSTFTLAVAEKGKTVTVKVTGKLTGYASASKTSKGTKKVAG